MAIELARAHALPKPWGVVDLWPWSNLGSEGGPIGEIWYQQSGTPASEPSLLLKLLFTSQPLSIQVHPDDAFARSVGLTCGKTEAWYILSAAPGAKVAVGLKDRLTPRQLREVVENGSIVRHIAWRTVLPGDVVFVPAGTIHAIGAGLVIAELQQRSDATFRMFDFGRARELQIERAIAVADAGPAGVTQKPKRLTDERTLLASNPHFAFERIVLAPAAALSLEEECETWLLVESGSGRVGKFGVGIGDAIFAHSDRIDLRAGHDGMACLVAYAGAGGPIARPVAEAGTADAGGSEEKPFATFLARASASPANAYAGALQ